MLHGAKGARGERRNKGIAKARKERRREEAELRQSARAARSDTHQLWLLKNERRGSSKREKARLRAARA